MIQRRRKTLPEILAERVVRNGSLFDWLTDAVLAQDMRWLEDRAAGRRSEI